MEDNFRLLIKLKQDQWDSEFQSKNKNILLQHKSSNEGKYQE